MSLIVKVVEPKDCPFLYIRSREKRWCRFLFYALDSLESFENIDCWPTEFPEDCPLRKHKIEIQILKKGNNAFRRQAH